MAHTGKHPAPHAILETTWRREGYVRVAGVDEVGRGALFGPVVAAAVILPPEWRPELAPGLRDSKLLTPEQRERIYECLVAQVAAHAVGVVPASTIDEIGIAPAVVQAMSLAVAGLSLSPQLLVVDGRGPLPPGCAGCAVIDGDALCASVAAASVIAKVSRDRLIRDLSRSYPGYDLEHNMGYGTPRHLAALSELGQTPLHRRSFAPVASAE